MYDWPSWSWSWMTNDHTSSTSSGQDGMNSTSSTASDDAAMWMTNTGQHRLWHNSGGIATGGTTYAWLAMPIMLGLNVIGFTVNLWYLILISSRKRLQSMNYFVLVGQAMIDLIYNCSSGINAVLSIAFADGEQYPSSHCALQGFWLMFPVPASIMHFVLISYIRRYNVVNVRGAAHAYSTHSSAAITGAAGVAIGNGGGGHHNGGSGNPKAMTAVARNSNSLSPAASSSDNNNNNQPNVITPRVYIRMCVLICLAALIISSAGLFMPKTQFELQPSSIYCFAAPSTFFVAGLLIFLLGSVAFIGTNYYRIYRFVVTVRQNARLRQNVWQKRITFEAMLAERMVAIVVVFFSFYIPVLVRYFGCIGLSTSLCNSVLVDTIIAVAVCIQIVLNPIMYFALDPKLRYEAREGCYSCRRTMCCRRIVVIPIYAIKQSPAGPIAEEGAGTPRDTPHRRRDPAHDGAGVDDHDDGYHEHNGGGGAQPHAYGHGHNVNRNGVMISPQGPYRAWRRASAPARMHEHDLGLPTPLLGAAVAYLEEEHGHDDARALAEALVSGRSHHPHHDGAIGGVTAAMASNHTHGHGQGYAPPHHAREHAYEVHDDEEAERGALAIILPPHTNVAAMAPLPPVRVHPSSAPVPHNIPLTSQPPLMHPSTRAMPPLNQEQLHQQHHHQQQPSLGENHTIAPPLVSIPHVPRHQTMNHHHQRSHDRDDDSRVGTVPTLQPLPNSPMTPSFVGGDGGMGLGLDGFAVPTTHTGGVTSMSSVPPPITPVLPTAFTHHNSHDSPLPGSNVHSGNTTPMSMPPKAPRLQPQPRRPTAEPVSPHRHHNDDPASLHV